MQKATKNKEELVDGMIEKSKKRVEELATKHGHTLGEPWNNKELELRQCTKCLALAIRESPGTQFGTALAYPCDPNASDKRMEFPNTPMSEEHRARINKPWKAPSEKDALK